MQAYQVVAGRDLEGLELTRREARDPGPHEVKLRVRAVSLNFRDLMIVRGQYPTASAAPVIPASDAAGEVVAVGSAVTAFKVGDRVVSSFFPGWIDGPPTPARTAVTLGADSDGVLAEEVVLPAQSLVATPAHLDDVEASTLPCAGVTAWNALFVAGNLKPGDRVLLLGTGGVSIWALQLAHAAGLRTIVTSSSDAKLERARALGADATINYRDIPEWQDEVARLTDGQGVELAVEVGGTGTLERSLASVGMGGNVAVIGGLAGFGASGVSPIALIGGSKRLSGISVGSRAMAQALNRFVESAALRPVVDRVFDFAQAPDAYRHLAEGQHFGKVVIRVGR